MEQVEAAQSLLAQVETYLEPADQAVVLQALAMARVAHEGYSRLDGSPYINHAIAVAEILSSWRAPAAVLVVGLLHDVLKEHYAARPSPDAIHQVFGPTVAKLVEEVSRLGRLGPVYPAHKPDELLDTIEHMAERMPWVLLSLQRAPLAGVVKIADRLHNFQSLAVHSPERQVAFAANTMSIFVPFADRLGMHQAKQALEDYAFRILDPAAYEQIQANYPRSLREAAVTELVNHLQQYLAHNGIQAHVRSQPLSNYALHRQQLAHSSPSLKLAQPILIVTQKTIECYQALGLIHQLWPPLPGKLWDYIAVPKANGYQSLHTRVRHSSGETLLVLIRDEQMNLVSDYGVTAAWRGVPNARLPQFPPWQEPPPGKIAVFTPDSDLHILPAGALPIDLAYAVHINLGHQCTGVEVNGLMAPLDRPLENGDVVKILTSSANVGPSPDWPAIVKTTRARRAIRRWFRQQNSGDTAESGRTPLEANWPPEGIIWPSTDEENSRQPADIASLADQNLPQRLAGCCRPQPPDAIVGYITRRRVIMIHRADCYRVRLLRPLLKADWKDIGVQYLTEIDLLALDRVGLVRDVSTIIAETAISMASFHADQMPDGSAHLQIGLGDMPQAKLGPLLNRLRRVPGVRQAEANLPSRPTRFIVGSVLGHHFNNPYTLRPVSGKGFYGRRAELHELVNNLRDAHPGEAILLWGPRRIGKTSLLLEFQQNVLSEDYVLAFVDMQALSGSSTPLFLRHILKEIVRSLPDDNCTIPGLSRMKRDPLGYFGGFLENEPHLHHKHIVLIFDEFQLLASLHEERVSLADINRYFRSLIQHRSGLSIIFSGGGVLDKLLHQPAASFMLEVARHQQIGCLDLVAARQLIVDPVQRVQYEPGVVEQLLALTAGHPYYLQWLCGELLLQADREQRPLVAGIHLQALLESWLPHQGEQFFSHLWGSSIGFDRQSQQRYKLVLTAVAVASQEGPVSLDEVSRSELSAVLDELAVWQTLQELLKMDTLVRTEDEHYCLKVKLCAHWLRANYTIERLMRETTW